MSDAIVIAHRGASGYLPEHTLAAKALAFGLGADFLEQDVVGTRDGALVVLHDLYLDDVSDVALRFPGRERRDGRHYVIDFDLAELRTLSMLERRKPGTTEPRFAERFPRERDLFRVATLEEELTLIRGLNRTMRRRVGIYPEIKHPGWHREHGLDITSKLIGVLRDFGYVHATDPAFVQCFDARELERLAKEQSCQLRLIQLIGTEPEYQRLQTPQGLKAVKQYAFGLGPSYRQLATAAPAGGLCATPLKYLAEEAGLVLHPYTFRADELPPFVATLEELLVFFLREARVAGVFCDQPDVAVRVRNSLRKVQ